MKFFIFTLMFFLLGFMSVSASSAPPNQSPKRSLRDDKKINTEPEGKNKIEKQSNKDIMQVNRKGKIIYFPESIKNGMKELDEDNLRQGTNNFYSYELYEAAIGAGDEEGVYQAKANLINTNTEDNKNSKIYNSREGEGEDIDVVILAEGEEVSSSDRSKLFDGISASSSSSSASSPMLRQEHSPNPMKENDYTKLKGAWLRPQSRQWPWCAWPGTTDAQIFTPLLMDPNAVYQPQLVQFDSNDYDGRRVYRIKSEYQQGIYFSYTAYNMIGVYSASVKDKEISPHWGCNPYTDIECTPETSGGYEMYITRFGNTGRYTNELGIAEEEGADDTIGIIMLRIYWAVRFIDSWGSVPPPVVEVSNDYGTTWETIHQCDEEESLRFNRFMRRIYEFLLPAFPTLIDRDGKNGEQRQALFCPLLDTIGFEDLNDNPAYYPQINSGGDDEGVEQGFEPFSNPDSMYVYWCNIYSDLLIEESKRAVWMDNYISFGVINGKSGPVADGLYHGNRVADEDSYETRYTSMESADTVLPQPTFQSVSGAQLQEYYAPNWDYQYRALMGVGKEENARGCYNSLKNRGELRYIPGEENFDFNTSGKKIPWVKFYPDPSIADVGDPEMYVPVIPTYIFRVQEQKDPEQKELFDYCKGLDEEAQMKECFNSEWLQNYSEKWPLVDIYICDINTNNAVKSSVEFIYHVIDNLEYVPIY